MIAVARSGNNNLCHIVTPNHGKKSGSRDTFSYFRSNRARYTHGE
jgi:hypothetical protein